MAASNSNSHPLVGKIVAWPCSPGEDGPDRWNGHGEVVAALNDTMILVRQWREDPADEEPSSMTVFSLSEAGLRFFDNEAGYRAWMAWIERSADAGGTERQNAHISTRRH